VANTSNLKPFQPGNPGRPKGIPNKFTSLKAAFLEAFEKTGGADGLVAWVEDSRQNRLAFYQMITRLFPQEVAHSGAIKTADKLILEVVHTRPLDKGGNGDSKGNGGDCNGGEKK
jgi:hypothetical protein